MVLVVVDVPATMLGSLVSPTAIARSATPNFFGPSRPVNVVGTDRRRL